MRESGLAAGFSETLSDMLSQQRSDVRVRFDRCATAAPPVVEAADV
jgi:hypothetical protein